MAKRLRCWKKGKHNTFHRKDGVELESFGLTMKYPYIVIAKRISQKINDYEVIVLYNRNYSDVLAENKTRPKAFSFAEKYMGEHDTC